MPASRRTSRKGDRNEQAILETAEKLLADRPLSSIAIDELASGAGISRPTFYFYFPSREAVLYTLAERLHDELFRCSEVWFRRSDESPSEAVRRASTATLALWRRHGPVLRATVRARDVDPELREYWVMIGKRFIDATEEQIERERTAGLALPPPPSARSLASILVSMNEQACFNTSLRRKSAAIDREVVDTLTTIWVRTVYGTEPDSPAHEDAP